MRVRKAGEHGGPPGVIPTPFTLQSPLTSECPRSLITQRSEDLVQIINLLTGTQELTGSGMLADDLPGAVLDAIRLARRETRAMESAQDEAVANS